MTLDQEIMQLAADLGIELVPGEVNKFADSLMRLVTAIKNLPEENYQSLLIENTGRSEVIKCIREINLEDAE